MAGCWSSDIPTVWRIHAWGYRCRAKLAGQSSETAGSESSERRFGSTGNRFRKASTWWSSRGLMRSRNCTALANPWFVLPSDWRKSSWQNADGPSFTPPSRFRRPPAAVRGLGSANPRLAADRPGDGLSMDAQPDSWAAMPFSAHLQPVFHRGGSQVRGPSGGVSRGDADLPLSSLASRWLRSPLMLPGDSP
jgi:hypothetical protein